MANITMSGIGTINGNDLAAQCVFTNMLILNVDKSKVKTTNFTVTSVVRGNGNTLPVEYICDIDPIPEGSDSVPLPIPPDVELISPINNVDFTGTIEANNTKLGKKKVSGGSMTYVNNVKPDPSK